MPEQGQQKTANKPVHSAHFYRNGVAHAILQALRDPPKGPLRRANILAVQMRDVPTAWGASTRGLQGGRLFRGKLAGWQAGKLASWQAGAAPITAACDGRKEGRKGGRETILGGSPSGSDPRHRLSSSCHWNY
jgi:hypothetical protein